MANSILKLKVESEEYDAKLKKAAEGIRHLADVAHKGGGELTGLEKAELDYIKALGDMETKSRTAAGSTRELENAFKELTVIYNNLSDVEKADEGGKALAASLEKLKQRTIDAKSQLDAATKSLQSNESAGQSNSSALDQLASKFTVNIDAVKLFNIGLQAAEGALNVAKDAFFASEANVDEWGRTIQSAQGLYEGFLNALNTGDISGYLSRMDEIVRAARAAYDELDKLGTMKTIQAPKVSAQQTENERIRSMIQTGRYIAPVDGRRNAVFNGREMQNGDKLTAGQIRALEKQLQNGMQNVVKLVGNEVKQTGKAIDAYYNSIAKQNGMSLQEFKKGTSSWEEFSKKMQGYEQYKEWDKQARIEFAKQGGRGNVDFDKNNPFAEFKKWGVFRVDKEGGNSYKDLVQLIQQRDQQAAQAYGMQSQAYRTMNRAEGFTVSKLMGKGGKGGSGSKVITEEKDDFTEIIGLIGNAEERVRDLQNQIKEAPDETTISILRDQLKDAQQELDRLNGKTAWEKGFSGVTTNAMSAWAGAQKKSLGDTEVGSKEYADISANIVDTETLSNLLQKATEEGLANVAENINAEGLWESILNGENIPDEVWESIVEEMNDALSELGVDPIKLNVDTGKVIKDVKKVEKEVKGISTAASTVASVVGSIGQAFNQIEDPAAKVAGTVAQAIATLAAGYATATAQASSMGPWAWIAFAATGLATLISTVSSIHNITGYAQGGIVQGNTFSGDQVGPVMLDAGEVVLNRSQVGNLAAQLEDSRNSSVGNSHPYVSGEMIYLGMNNYLKRSGRGEIITSRG